MPIRSDKGRKFTQQESDWFWELQHAIVHFDQRPAIHFPDAWKYFDAGFSPAQVIKLATEQRDAMENKLTRL